MERVLDVVLGYLAIDQIARVDIANVVLVEDLIDFWLLVNRKDIPICVNHPADCSEDDFATWVVGYPICDVVDFGSFNHPSTFSGTTMLSDLLEANRFGRRRRLSVSCL